MLLMIAPMSTVGDAGTTSKRRQLGSAMTLTLMLVACGGGASSTEGVESTVTVDITVAETDTAGSTSEASVTDGDAGTAEAEQLFPDVVGVEAAQGTDGSWTFNVTLSSPYDSPARYADAWRVVGPDGTVFGERILLHDHAGEQPFTRSQSGIEIPEDVTEVLVEGRDQLSGWGGATMTITLHRS